MKANNALTLDFIVKHPVDAARTLSRLSPEYCQAFLEQIDNQSLQRLFPLFNTAYAASCLMSMSNQLLTRCTQTMLPEVSRALLGLSPKQQDSVIQRVDPKLSAKLKKQLAYPRDSVARFFRQKCPVLPASLVVEEALKQLEKINYDDGCQLNLIDDNNKLLGNLDIGRLIHANQKDRLDSLILSQSQPKILVNSRMSNVENNPAWLSHRQLPVVDHKGVFMGELEYEAVKRFNDKRQKGSSAQAFDGLLSLAGLFWMTTSWLVDCLFGAESNKDNRSH